MSKKNCYFHTHTDKNSVFLKPKFLQKGKITGGPKFFPQRPNFSSELAEKFCKELATLHTRDLSRQRQIPPRQQGVVPHHEPNNLSPPPREY
jgi:hypothetical protein